MEFLPFRMVCARSYCQPSPMGRPSCVPWNRDSMSQEWIHDSWFHSHSLEPSLVCKKLSIRIHYKFVSQYGDGIHVSCAVRNQKIYRYCVAPNINPAPGNPSWGNRVPADEGTDPDPCGDPGSNWHSLSRRGRVTVPGGQGPGASSGVLNIYLVRRIVVDVVIEQ